MTRFVCFAVLFDLLTKCSALSRNMIDIVVLNDGTVIPYTTPILTLNEHFTIVVQSDYGHINLIRCGDRGYGKKIQIKLTPLAQMNHFQHVTTGNSNGTTTAAMHGTWNCILFFKEAVRDVVFLLGRFEVDVRGSSSAKNYGPGGVKNSHDAPEHSSDNIYVTPTPVIDNEEHVSTEHPRNSKAHFNTLVVIISVAMVLILMGIVAAVNLSIVCQKVRARKDAAKAPTAMKYLYEEVVYTAAPNNIANRPPLPLPPPAPECEMEKYIHYDTPYDHRFMRFTAAEFSTKPQKHLRL